MKFDGWPLRITALALLAALAGCSARDWTVTYVNGTTVPLDYCVVVTDPPPPHRACTRKLQPGLAASVDPLDFNPVIWDPGSKLGTIVLMALGEEPPTVLVRRLQYQVEPGQEGNDPALQPALLEDLYLEADPDGNKEIQVVAGPIAEGYPVKLLQKP